MEKDRIIRKIEEPTDRVSSLAYSWKSNGQMRICLDPKDLNKAIKRCHHRVLTLEEINHQIASQNGLVSSMQKMDIGLSSLTKRVKP